MSKSIEEIGDDFTAECRQTVAECESVVYGIPYFDETPAKMRWPAPIPVTERLPEDETPIPGYSPRFGWMRFRYSAVQEGEIVFKDEDWGFHRDITHWLPLPPAPEVKP